MILAAILLLALVSAPSSAFMSTSSSKATTSLQALSLERFREDSRYKDPYQRSKFSYDPDHYYRKDYNRYDYDNRRGLVNPRNDVFRRSDVINKPPRYDDEYRRNYAYGTSRSLVNPRNDVYRRSDAYNRPRYDDDYRRSNSYNNYRRSIINPRNDVYARGYDRATENMVDRELSKIRAMGKYTIENELSRVYGVTPQYDLSKEELACLLLKERLQHNSGYAPQRYSGTYGKGQYGSSNMWSDNFWRN